MHLVGPYLSTTGKRKGKPKFRNAEQARQARELAAEWERKQAEWKAMSKSVPANTKSTFTYNLSTPVGRETKKIPSLGTHVTGPVTSKPSQQYTGDEMLGITIVHKSCLQPVFNHEAMKDSAKMRR